MSDQDGTSLEKFLPGAEPLKPETPPQPEVPETPPATEGTPSPEAPATEPVVEPQEKQEPTAPPQKTPEQLAQDRAYYQAESQKAKEELKRLRDEFAQITAPQTPSDAKLNVPQTGTYAERLKGMTTEQIEQWIAENPHEASLAAQEKIKSDILGEIEAREQKQNADLTFRLETREANRWLNEFNQRNKITADEFKEATDYVTSLGIKASPTAIAELVTRQLIAQRLLTNTAMQVETVKADAAQKVKQQLLTKQPGAGALPASKPMTYEESVAAKFTKSKEDKALAGFFGSPN